MAQGLPRLLSELEALLSELAVPPADDGRQPNALQQRAKEWRNAAVDAAAQAGRLDGEPADELCRTLRVAAENLFELEAPAHQQPGGLPRWLYIAVKLLHGCAALASTRPDASQSAMAMLWLTAAVVINHSSSGMQTAATWLAEDGPHDRVASGLFAHINSHSKPLIALLQCPNSGQPEPPAVPVATLVEWTVEAAKMLRTLRAHHGLTDEYAVCLGRVLELLLLLDCQPPSQLAPEVQQQQRVALCAVALDVVLPQLTAVAAGLSVPADRRRRWCTWPHAAQCAAAATCTLMQPAVEQLVQAAGRDRASPEAARLARLLLASAALVLHMPAGAAAQQAGGGACQCQLLALLAAALQAQLDLARSSGVVAAQVQQARHLLPLLPRLVGLAAPECRSTAPLLQVVSTASLLLFYLSDLVTASNMQANRVVRSLADMPDWCAAASAALRMLPAAAEAAQTAEEQAAAAGAAQEGEEQAAAARTAPQAEEQAAAAGAAQHAEERAAAAGGGEAGPGQPSPGLLAFAAGALFRAIGQQCVMAAGQAAVTATVDDAAASAATTALLQLHSTACRAAAWAAASGTQRWLPCLHTTVRFDALVASPATALCWLLDGGPARSQPGPPTELASRQAASFAVAHFAALSSLADSSERGDASCLSPATARKTVDGFIALLQCGPAALAAHPDVQPLLLTCLSALPQEGTARWEHLQIFVQRASVAWTPLPGALLLGTSAWETLGGRQLESATGMQLVIPLMQALLVVLQRLDTAAAEAAQEATTSDIDSHPFNQLLSAVDVWKAGLLGTVYEPDRWQHDVQGHLEQLRAKLQSAVPAAKGLAAALLEWWRRPAAQQVAALELAQAAAYRSCAYLRCANLGGEGGPAAGEGVGSLRCSACRAVWYCGTACSHADWRAGHRRVCKALAAARAAEKERRRQAAAAAAGEESG